MGKIIRFVGWDRPLAVSVSECMLQGVDVPGLVDLRDTVIVVPTRQAAWHLSAALPDAARREGASLLGPHIVSPAELIAASPQAGLASDFRLLSAWVAVLDSEEARELSAFLGPRESRTRGADGELRIARQLQRLRHELSDANHTLSSVADSGEAIEEQERWDALRKLEELFHKELESHGLKDPLALKMEQALNGELDSEIKRVILAAVPDPTLLLTNLLGKWSQNGGLLEILVAAPDSERHTFNDWGRPIPDAWGKRRIDLANDNIWVAANPADAAARIVTELGNLFKRDSSADGLPHIAIGVPDREAVPALQRKLAEIDMPSFDPQNRAFETTPLAHLLQALLKLRHSDSYPSVASLLRHPDILDHFGNATQLLGELDRYQSDYLPVSLRDIYRRDKGAEKRESHTRANSRASEEKEKSHAAFLAAVDTIGEWRKKLMRDDIASALRSILSEIFEGKTVGDTQDDKLFEESVKVFDDSIRQLESAAETGYKTEHSGDILAALLQDATIKAERAGQEVNLEGWLELAWNGAPLLFVAGLNEGYVPDSKMGDVFLPNTLRDRLELRDDSLRIARDAYLLTTMLEQRKAAGHLVLVVNRASLAGDPLRPSRLLFRCSDDKLVERTRKLFADPQPLDTLAPFKIDERWKLQPDQAPKWEEYDRRLTKMSPSAFNNYLRCPFRFYLQDVLETKKVDDLSREPDQLVFGTLLHDTLEAMAKDAIAESWGFSQWRQLDSYLQVKITRVVEQRYGTKPWLGVTAMLDSARERLSAFAKVQIKEFYPEETDYNYSRWRIIACELSGECEINGCKVSGTIDRIDIDATGTTLRILDYKTSDKGDSAQDVHLGTVPKHEVLNKFICMVPGKSGKAKEQAWRNLQLPIYYQFARKIIEAFDDRDNPELPGFAKEVAAKLTRKPEKIEVGYIALPKSLADVKFDIWESYDIDIHGAAMDCAEKIVGNIKNGIFWPPADWPSEWDDFANMLLSSPEQTVAEPSSPWEVK